MPIEIDDVSIRIIGNNVKGLRFYDDGRALQQEIYLQSDNTLNIGVAGSGGGSGGGTGITTHAIDGTAHSSTLADIQAPQFLLLDGSREMAGALDMGGYAITDVGLVDGVDVSAHAARHGSAGGDAVDHDGLTNFVANEHINHTAVTLTAGDGLTGGGDISASRTFAVGAGTLITVAADNVGITAGANYQFIGTGAGTAAAWQNMSGLAGNGLTHTTGVLAVGAGTLITVAADTVGVTPGSAEGQALVTGASPFAPGYSLTPTWAGLHTFNAGIDVTGTLEFQGSGTITATTGGNVTISPTGDVFFNPAGNYVSPLTNYDTNLGMLSKKYLSLHCAELWVETLVAQDTIATIGGRILVGPTTTLTSDLAAAGTTIYVKHNQMAVGDRAYLEADGKVEFVAITAGPAGIGPYSYTVTRNLDGTGANDWYAGDAVFNTGTTGDGFIDIYSVRGVKSATQYGPTIVGNVRNSATYNDWTEAWAIGNLNGLYGYGTDTYGVGLGKYVSGQANITVDPTNGLRLRTYTTTILQIKNTDSKGYIVGPLYLDTGGGIYQGTGTFASPTIGLKIWNDGGIGRIGGYNGGALQWYASTDGKLYAGAGQVVLDSGGITIAGGSSLGNFLRWVDGSNTVSVIGSYTDAGYNFTEMVASYVSPNYGWMRLTAYGASGAQSGYIDVIADATTPGIGMTVGGVTGVTLRSTGVTITVPIQLSEYIYHEGDADTYQRYQSDRWTLAVGGVTMLDAVEAATDYLQVGGYVGIGAAPTSEMLYVLPSDSVSVSGIIIKQGLTSGASSWQNLLQILNKADSEQLVFKARGSDGATAMYLSSLGTVSTRDVNGFGFLTSANAAQVIQAKAVLLGTSYSSDVSAVAANTIASVAGTSIYLNPSGGTVGIGTTSIGGLCTIDQPSTTAAIPVLELDQADLSEEFINFISTVGAGYAIDTAAIGTYYGKVRVSVNGSFKYLALYNS